MSTIAGEACHRSLGLQPLEQEDPPLLSTICQCGSGVSGTWKSSERVSTCLPFWIESPHRSAIDLGTGEGLAGGLGAGGFRAERPPRRARRPAQHVIFFSVIVFSFASPARDAIRVTASWIQRPRKVSRHPHDDEPQAVTVGIADQRADTEPECRRRASTGPGETSARGVPVPAAATAPAMAGDQRRLPVRDSFAR